MLDYDAIAYRIWDLRKNRKKVSQKRMADELGMHQPDLSDLEHNKAGCGIHDLSKLETIANYLNVPLGYLLFGEQEDERADWVPNDMKEEYIPMSIPTLSIEFDGAMFGLIDIDFQLQGLKQGIYLIGGDRDAGTIALAKSFLLYNTQARYRNILYWDTELSKEESRECLGDLFADPDWILGRVLSPEENEERLKKGMARVPWDHITIVDDSEECTETFYENVGAVYVVSYEDMEPADYARLREMFGKYNCAIIVRSMLDFKETDEDELMPVVDAYVASTEDISGVFVMKPTKWHRRMAAVRNLESVACISSTKEQGCACVFLLYNPREESLSAIDD